jgi:hypothetical protein
MSLTIPDDVLAAARQRAEARGTTLGEALVELARRGIEADEGDFWKGVELFPHRELDPPVTMDLVSRLREEVP